MENTHKVIKVNIEEATSEQLKQFCQFNELEGWKDLKNVGQFRRFVIDAGYVKQIILVELEEVVPVDAALPAYAEEWDGTPEKERFCQIKIHAERKMGEQSNRLMPVPVDNGGVGGYLPRETMLLVRERMFVMIRDCRPTERHQDQDRFGFAIGKFEDAVVTVVDRYPYTLYGYRGYLADGHNLREMEIDPESVHFIFVVPHKGMDQHEAREIMRRNEMARRAQNDRGVMQQQRLSA